MASMASRVRLAAAESDRLVNRLKNTNLDKFHMLCKMHLSFLLHLPGSTLDDFLSDGGASWSSGSLTPSEKTKFRLGKKKTNKHEKEVKGVELLAITQDTIDQLLPLIDYLNNDNNIKQEGLFRKSGHIGRQKLLREKLQNGEDVRLELESGIYSAHDCASVLKAYLSDLQEPVLTERHYQAHCQIPEMESETKQLQTLQLLVQLLPSENLFLLQCLLLLLNKVAKESENKMTSETLGTLFAPHLLVPRKMSASELQAVAADLTKSVAFMIDNADEIFKLPLPLIRDIATYWAQMEESMTEHTDDRLDAVRLRYRSRANPIDVPIHTSITFADRQASQQAASKTDTQMALAQLYAHVSSMPESAKKRRLLKQFNKANGVSLASSPAPEKHKRTKSFGDSIKKMVGRNHRRRGSSHSLQIQQELSNLENTPFSSGAGKYTASRQSACPMEKSTSKHSKADEHNDTRITGADGRSTDPVVCPVIRRPLLPKSSQSHPNAITSYLARLRYKAGTTDYILAKPNGASTKLTPTATISKAPRVQTAEKENKSGTLPPSPTVRQTTIIITGMRRTCSTGKLPLLTPIQGPDELSHQSRKSSKPSSPILGLIRRRSFKDSSPESGSRSKKKNRVSSSPQLSCKTLHDWMSESLGKT